MALILVFGSRAREVEGLSPLYILPEKDAEGCVLSLERRLKLTFLRSAHASGMVDQAIKPCSDLSVAKGALDVAVPPTSSPASIWSTVVDDPFFSFLRMKQLLQSPESLSESTSSDAACELVSTEEVSYCILSNI